MSLKKQWNINISDLPKERSSPSLRSERFEALIQDPILSRAAVLAVTPNVWEDFLLPWFPLKLHFNPFKKVNRVMFNPGETDLELLDIFYGKNLLKPCLESFKFFFPGKEAPEYFKERCPLCAYDVAAVRYVFYGGILTGEISLSTFRRIMVSFRPGDLAEVMNSGGVLSENEGLFTFLGLKSVLEGFQKFSGEILRVLKYKEDFYLVTLKFDKMDDPVWQQFLPIFEEIKKRWFLWEPITVLVNSSLIPFLQEKERYSRLLRFYAQLGQIYDRVKKY